VAQIARVFAAIQSLPPLTLSHLLSRCPLRVLMAIRELVKLTLVTPSTSQHTVLAYKAVLIQS